MRFNVDDGHMKPEYPGLRHLFVPLSRRNILGLIVLFHSDDNVLFSFLLIHIMETLDVPKNIHD